MRCLKSIMASMSFCVISACASGGPVHVKGGGGMSASPCAKPAQCTQLGAPVKAIALGADRCELAWNGPARQSTKAGNDVTWSLERNDLYFDAATGVQIQPDSQGRLPFSNFHRWVDDAGTFVVTADPKPSAFGSFKVLMTIWYRGPDKDVKCDTIDPIIVNFE